MFLIVSDVSLFVQGYHWNNESPLLNRGYKDILPHLFTTNKRSLSFKYVTGILSKPSIKI